jgi:glycosyltransferase involved in cell wall biosynthesis
VKIAPIAKAPFAGLRVLITADAVGGVWQYSVELAHGLAALGVEPLIATVGPSPSADQLAALGAAIRVIDTGLALDWLAEDAASVRKAGETVADLAAREGADIVQLNSPALAAEARFAMPVVAVQHSCVASWWEAVRGTELPEDFAWRTGLVRAGLLAADKVVAPTAAFAEATRRLYRLPETPAAVHNGRTPLKLPDGAPHDFVFTAGRLWDEGKNLATLDAAAAGIAVPVHAAGPVRGPNGTAVEFETIHCLGTLGEAEIGRWLAAKPVFASAALYEPFGLAVLEAAAAGCPLVLSDIATFRELWDGAATFVDPRDAAGFTAAISNIVGNDFLRGAMGRAARERAARYTPQATAARMAAIYGELLSAVQAPARSSAKAVA